MANERLMATSWRYEKIKTATNSRAVAQHKKIEAYEKSMSQILDQEKINKSSFKIDWNNNFDILNEKYVCNNENKGQDNELKIIRKATVLVRRDALKKLFQKEYEMYEKELNKRGYTIHRERI